MFPAEATTCFIVLWIKKIGLESPAKKPLRDCKSHEKRARLARDLSTSPNGVNSSGGAEGHLKELSGWFCCASCSVCPGAPSTRSRRFAAAPVAHILFLIGAANTSCCVVATKAFSDRCGKSTPCSVFLKAFLKLTGWPDSFSLSTLKASTFPPRYVKLTFHTKRNHFFGP